MSFPSIKCGVCVGVREVQSGFEMHPEQERVNQCLLLKQPQLAESLRELSSNIANKSSVDGKCGITFLESFVMKYSFGAAPVPHS